MFLFYLTCTPIRHNAEFPCLTRIKQSKLTKNCITHLTEIMLMIFFCQITPVHWKSSDCTTREDYTNQLALTIDTVRMTSKNYFSFQHRILGSVSTYVTVCTEFVCFCTCLAFLQVFPYTIQYILVG